MANLDAQVLLRTFLLLVTLEKTTYYSSVHCEVLNAPRNSYNNGDSRLNNVRSGNLPSWKKNTFEDFELHPAHWDPLDNVHKKKQFPRSSRGNRQEMYAGREKLRKTSSARLVDSTRSGRFFSSVDHATLKPAANFNALEDVEKLRALLRSKLINDDEIIGIMTKRTNDQRNQIIQLYPDLKGDFGLKLSFGFRELMKALATPLPEFHAKLLKEAFSSTIKLDEDLLVELLCTLSNSQFNSVQQAYRRLYRKEIQDELQPFSRNPFIRFLIAYVQAKRDEKNINQQLATFDAQQLQSAGRLTIDYFSTLWKILINRSFPHLKLVFSEYKRITGKNIKETIRKNFSGSTRNGLINIVKTISSRPQYFAEILNESVRNFNKRDATLIRVILLRAEIDMEDIKTAYKKMYNIPLAASIPTNTGSLKKALISLISG